MKKFIMYGAGNIGRGFIGQLFSNAGYKVGFIDVNKEVINRLNTDGEYPVNVVTTDSNVEQIVKNAYGIDGTDNELVASEIASADIMATAIGVNILKFIAKPLALGLKKRFEQNAPIFNIIICENMIGADQYLKGLIKNEIPEYADRIDKEIGFVEPSIGRMVPVVTEDKKMGNPLRVYVEPYNILPIDKEAFKGEIPEIANLYPFAPFNLFIQRKLFMHNMSHAVTAYLGNLRNYEYIYQATADFDIKYVSYRALIESAQALAKENGVDIKLLTDHADDLLYRFTNTALGDTVERVGKDTKRKLGENDRLIGALKLCEKFNLETKYIAMGVAAGMFFAPDSDESSKELKAYALENGAKATLKTYSNYEGEAVQLIETYYEMIKAGKTIKDLVDYANSLCAKQIKV